MELGKGEVKRGDKGKGSEPEITEWRAGGGGGDEPEEGRGTRRRNDRAEMKTTAE